MSYHKFNESQREQVVLRRLKQGEIVALISDAGMPGISDPGMELVSAFSQCEFIIVICQHLCMFMGNASNTLFKAIFLID